jgi:predicted lipoprotein with Yx(FWY)xxD motif
MHRTPKSARLRRRTSYAAFLIAIVAVVALAGMAVAKSVTLSVAKSGKVTNQKMVTKTEAIAVNSKGRAVYDLVPETVHHALCTKANGCLAIWLPITVPTAKSRPSVANGIKGKLGIWHRNGFFQVTLAGHPLYTFIVDTKKNDATGEGIVHFGGTWHVIKSSSSSSSKTSQSGSTTSTTSTMTTPSYPGY